VPEAASATSAFVQTGGPLPADAHTAAMRGAANGFRVTTGNPPGGTGDGAAGDGDTAPSAVAPSFARVVGGPGGGQGLWGLF
jgi:hypothetical protein